MSKYIDQFEVNQSELDEIMAELDRAKEAIYKCYSRLQELDMLVLKEEKEDAASGN